MSGNSTIPWQTHEYYQNADFAKIWAKHRNWTIAKILDSTCFLIKIPLLGIVKAKTYFYTGNAEEFIKECYRFSKENNIPTIEIFTCSSGEAFAQFQRKPQGTFVINLCEDKTILFNRIQKRARKYIKNAPKKGVQVEIIDNREDFDKWWEVYMSTVYRKDFVYYNYDLARDIFLHQHLSKLFVAKINDDIACGCFLLCGQHTVVHWISGTNIELSEYRPNYYLRWKMIEWAKERGYTYYDMGGAVPVDYDAAGKVVYIKKQGPSAFKKAFGGEYKESYRYDIITSKFKHKSIDALIYLRYKVIKYI